MFYRWLALMAMQVAILTATFAASAAPPKPIPPSPYLPVVYRYADAMLQHGRDTHGPQQTGLFLSALDRKGLVPLAGRPVAPAGINESHRAASKTGPIVGASPTHDANLLRLLYTLSALSSKPVYGNAADAELSWFLKNTSPNDACGAFGSSAYAWDVVADAAITSERSAAERFSRPWMLWDRCFILAPDASRAAIKELVKSTATDKPSVRNLGFNLRALATAYQATRDGALLVEIDNHVALLEKSVDAAAARHDDSATSAGLLSATIDCGGAAGRVTPPLAKRLRAIATRVDHDFLAVPHDLKGAGGFALSPSKNAARSTLWTVSEHGGATAAIAMMCVSRYENTGNVGFRDLIHAAADAYRTASPRDDADIWPMTYGHAISLQLAAWRSTSRQEYLDRAIQLADEAIKTFWADSPLPCASSKTRHYEAITGADTLALALVELHLSILHITAVRTPPNTIDR